MEPFTTRQGSEELRSGVVAELRKLGSVQLALKESAADLVLGGGGEVWVRGYSTLNPRAPRYPRNGKPVYGGFLSVELRDKQGETLWSYLVTPNTATDDIYGNLSKQISKQVAKAVQQGFPKPSRPVAAPGHGTVELKGAGATFPYPLYTKWFANYHRTNPDVELIYEPVGSEAGIRRLLAGEVDFGASDSPDAIHLLAPGQEDKFVLFPSAVGAVVPIMNLPGVSGDIDFTPAILVGIYLGKIKKWNDPALRAANPKLHLPDLDITVIHRRDGSGTSYVWTDFLAQTSAEWKAKVGTGMNPAWPVGRSGVGNEGVATEVKEFGGAIGYVEFTYAVQNHLNFGKVRNQEGEFVGASLDSIAAAARRAVGPNGVMTASIVNAPGPGAYPISSFTWLVVPAHPAEPAKRRAMAAFLRWATGPGQRQAAALGYLALPKEVVAKVEADIARLE